jgi:radical SAM superfamily enzyme YgiQ (UPF0313 family)
MGTRRRDLVLLAPIHPWSPSVPLGLMSLAAFARREGYSAEILVGTMARLKTQLAQFDLSQSMLGFSATTDVVELAIDLCNWIKSRPLPHPFCVLGGHHATALPRHTMEASRFDCLVCGEGEAATKELLEALRPGRCRPFGVRGTWERTTDGHIIQNPPRPEFCDLKDLPQPAYELVDFEFWRGGIRTHDASCRRVGYLLTSRGCPFRCAFCSSNNIWGRKLRHMPIEAALDMVERVVDSYRLDGISFLDDDLVANHKRMSQFCAGLVRRGLHKRIIWEAHSTAAFADPDIFHIMKDAGCVLVRIGLESGSDRVLRYLKQGQMSAEQNLRAVRSARAAGLNVFGSFIIGAPDEDAADVIATIEFIKTSGLTDAAVFVAVPYPGTKLYDDCVRRGFLLPDIGFSDFRVEGVGARPVIRNASFSSEQLDALRRLILIHVVEPLNQRESILSLDYASEIERIRRGDLANCEYRLPQKLKRICQRAARGAQACWHEPRKIACYLSRIFPHE